jgi:kynurenine formamidase
MVIIENLNDLASLIGKEFLIACFPLNIPNADASPVRAVGIEYNCT